MHGGYGAPKKHQESDTELTAGKGVEGDRWGQAEGGGQGRRCSVHALGN